MGKPGMWEAVRNNFTGVFIAYGHNIANIVLLQLSLDKL